MPMPPRGPGRGGLLAPPADWIVERFTDEGGVDLCGTQLVDGSLVVFEILNGPVRSIRPSTVGPDLVCQPWLCGVIERSTDQTISVDQAADELVHRGEFTDPFD